MPKSNDDSRPQSRAAFVKTMPIDMPSDDVIARGRKVGLDIKRTDVNAARFVMRHSGKNVAATSALKATKAKATKPTKLPRNGPEAGYRKHLQAEQQATHAPSANGKPTVVLAPLLISDDERQLRSLIVKLGTSRVREVLVALEAKAAVN